MQLPRATCTPCFPMLAGSFGSHKGAAVKAIALRCCSLAGICSWTSTEGAEASGARSSGAEHSDPLRDTGRALQQRHGRALGGSHPHGGQSPCPPWAGTPRHRHGDLGEGSSRDSRAAAVLHCETYGRHHKHWL